MFDKLAFVEKRFEEINGLLSTPEVVSDNELFKKLMKEHKELSPVVEKYREYVAVKNTEEEAKALLDEGGLDKDFKDLVEEEYLTAKADIERIGEELKILLLPKDPNDDRNVIVEIRGGAGGEESALFAHSLFRMYSMYAEAKRFKVDVINLNETELGG